MFYICGLHTPRHVQWPGLLRRGGHEGVVGLIHDKRNNEGSLMSWLLAQLAPRVFFLSVLRLVTDPCGSVPRPWVLHTICQERSCSQIKVGRQTNSNFTTTTTDKKGLWTLSQRLAGKTFNQRVLLFSTLI